jgi:hypothetical protein
MKKLLCLFTIAIRGLPSIINAGVQDRLYDFTDTYYLQNGIHPRLMAAGNLLRSPLRIGRTFRSSRMFARS